MNVFITATDTVWQWCVLTATAARIYLRSLGAPTAQTPRVQPLVRLLSYHAGPLVALSEPVGPSSRPSRLCSCSYIYVQYEKRHMAVGRKEVEIPGTCPIARCDRGFKSCRSQKFGSPTGSFNGPGQSQFPVFNFALFVPAAHQ